MCKTDGKKVSTLERVIKPLTCIVALFAPEPTKGRVAVVERKNEGNRNAA